MKRNRNPRFLKQCQDRAGNWVNQYRRNGKLIRLPNGRDFDDAFWKAYCDAERSILSGAVRQIAEDRTRLNSIDAALVGYYRSTIFRNLAANTRRTLRNALERDFRPVVGTALVVKLQTKHILDIVEEKAATTPTGAGGLLRAIRSFTGYCVSAELIPRDPSLGIKKPRPPKPADGEEAGHHTWIEAEIAQWENCHPIGSTARLALALHLCTGQRLGDVIRMGRQHVGRNRLIRLRQQKTGAEVTVPILPELQRALDAIPPSDAMTFLVASNGRPFSHSAYTQAFRKWRTEAGLPDRCTSHGLRKTCLTRLADAGCSERQIAAISGHKPGSPEIARYTFKADNERLAQQAIAALLASKTGTGTV